MSSSLLSMLHHSSHPCAVHILLCSVCDYSRKSFPKRLVFVMTKKGVPVSRTAFWTLTHLGEEKKNCEHLRTRNIHEEWIWRRAKSWIYLCFFISLGFVGMKELCLATWPKKGRKIYRKRYQCFALGNHEAKKLFFSSLIFCVCCSFCSYVFIA